MAFESGPPATSAGLQKWVKTLFMKLGWMLLAERSQRRSSIRSYMDDVRYVKGLLHQKAQGTIDPDRKADLLILHGNVQYLETRCQSIFGNVSGRRTGSTKSAVPAMGAPDAFNNTNTQSSDAILNSTPLPMAATSGLFKRRNVKFI